MTIKKRIAVSFVFMIVLPMLLMMLTGLFFQLYYSGSDFPADLSWRIHDRRMSHSGMPAGAAFFIAGTIVFLLAANAILSWTVSRSILRPLARLEAAALRIKEGDLSPDLSVHDRGGRQAGADEFGRVEASFEEMRQRLQETLRENMAEEEQRREMIAGISHDLRTPISAIKGYVEGLLDGVADTREKQDRYLHTIRGKAELLDRLIDDLSLYSGYETGTLTLDKTPMDFSSFLEETLDELAFDFPDLKMVHGEFDPINLDFDAQQFRRVVTNIVQNAARHAAPCTLRVTARTADSMATVILADDGPGIAEDDLPRIFERFYRADKARNQKTGGHGLGLSIAKMIVEAHGGKIRAESALGEGTRIILSLPLEPKRNG